MSGILFVVCIPRAEYENKLLQCEENSLLKARSKSSEDFSCGEKENAVRSKCASDSNVASFDFIEEAEVSEVENKKKGLKNSDEFTVLSFDRTPLEKILKELLARLHVDDAVWCLGRENKYYQVFFSIESNEVCEEMIQLFASFGIGTRSHSAVSVIPCALHYRADRPARDTPPDKAPPTAWTRFVASVRARTTLAQLLQDVRAEAALTFDWLFLLVVAAFLSAIGLVENSTVFLVASMLISPMMGPIMACAVGTAVLDYSLQRMGFLQELLGILLALLIGFAFGLVLCAMGDLYGGEVWPTYEMISRCEVRSLWVGVLIALPSAAAVALAVLGGYTASLVGVAISASLLPPAVNAGLLWSLAVTSLVSDGTGRWNSSNKTVYSTDLPTEVAMHGGISLCLTIVNILCIYGGGLIVYKIKEVAPIDLKNMKFWRPEVAAPDSPEEPEHRSGCSERPSPAPFPAWECFGWRPDRATLSRLSRDRRHDTWSPYSDLALPTARDVEAYWRQRRDSSPYCRTAKSQPCVPPPPPATDLRTHVGYTRLLDDSVEQVDTSSRREHVGWTGNDDGQTSSQTTGASKIKFTVTPVSVSNSP